MPVWHERTRELVASGEIVVIGIAQEQHPDRCRLFAQWQGLEWPILWDPFNSTGTAAVPVVTVVDELGVVHAAPLDPGRLGDELRSRELEPPAGGGGPEPAVRRELLSAPPPGEGGEAAAAWAMARFLWPQGAGAGDIDRAVELLRAAATAPGAGPEWLFRLGVAERLRYDSLGERGEDLAASLEHWAAALGREPGQYIWRRRLQQYGPRLDKPYPFYDWIERARAEVAARGQAPHPISVALSGAEVASSSRELERPGSAGARPGQGPDPDGKLPRDEQGWIRIDTAVAGHSDRSVARALRVHLVLRPARALDVHWSNEAGPTAVWLEPARGWSLEPRGATLPLGPGETSNELRVLDFEAWGDDGPHERDTTLRGYALYYVCQGRSGECSYLRQDFELELRTGE